MAATVHVKNIGAKTEDKEIKDFFSFCGKISAIDIVTEGDKKTATVTFEKETAARTALLLNHTHLQDHEIIVTSENISTSPPDPTGSASEPTKHVDTPAEGGPAVLTQEEKPRSRIVAELLAHGYLVADQGLQKAISLDEQHNISARFVSTLKQLDEKTHATDHARAADASYGISQRASSLLTGLGSYFEKARGTPTGKRIVEFYTTGQKQVQDIHNEARRLAELKKEETGGSLYKGLGLDKVLGRFHQGSEAPAASGGDAPGAAPAHAAATESATQPTAESKTGKPETIH